MYVHCVLSHRDSLYSTHWVEQWAYVELLDIALEQSCPGPFSQFCSVSAEIYSNDFVLMLHSVTRQKSIPFTLCMCCMSTACSVHGYICTYVHAVIEYSLMNR